MLGSSIMLECVLTASLSAQHVQPPVMAPVLHAMPMLLLTRDRVNATPTITMTMASALSATPSVMGARGQAVPTALSVTPMYSKSMEHPQPVYQVVPLATILSIRFATVWSFFTVSL